MREQLVFRLRDGCYIKEITLIKLPETEAEVNELATLLYRVESMKNLSELIREFKGESFYEPIIFKLVMTHRLSKNLYKQICYSYGKRSKIRDALMGTIYGKNPIPKRMYEKLRMERDGK